MFAGKRKVEDPSSEFELLGKASKEEVLIPPAIAGRVQCIRTLAGYKCVMIDAGLFHYSTRFVFA